MTEVMTHSHPRWREFCDRLGGPDGCDFRKGEDDEFVWSCSGDRTKAAGVLADLGFAADDVEASMSHFQKSGGHCDCEILLNMDKGTVEPCV